MVLVALMSKEGARQDQIRSVIFVSLYTECAAGVFRKLLFMRYDTIFQTSAGDFPAGSQDPDPVRLKRVEIRSTVHVPYCILHVGTLTEKKTSRKSYNLRIQ